MVINGSALLIQKPIKGMIVAKRRAHGVSYGLGEAGYDIRIKQKISFARDKKWNMTAVVDGIYEKQGRFVIASAIEEFNMPDNLVGIVHDKSTWARKGLSVFNTVIEPGWKGFLTLELVYHGDEVLIIPAEAGIAQVVFHETMTPALYTGKYQNQEDKPVPARD